MSINFSRGCGFTSVPAVLLLFVAAAARLAACMITVAAPSATRLPPDLLSRLLLPPQLGGSRSRLIRVRLSCDIYSSIGDANIATRTKRSPGRAHMMHANVYW